MKILVTVLFLSFISFGAFAQSETTQEGQFVPRTVLALVSDEHDKTLIHRNVEMVLNYYGIKVRYQDIDDPLPYNLKDIRGVLVWQKNSRLRFPKNFLEKFFKIKKNNIKFVFLGSIPGLIDQKSGLRLSEKLINERYGMFGIKIGRKLSPNPFGQKLEIHTKAMTEFERKIEILGRSLPEINIDKNIGKSHLSVSEKLPPKRRADLVVTSSYGGYALNPVVLSENPKTFLRQWTLNPFTFFEEAFDLKGLPRPDITTLNGRRMIYCHIDGDAFTGNCRFDKKRFCGEVVFDDVLKKYLFPHTLSLVHCWFDPKVRELDLISVEDGKLMDKKRVKFTKMDQERWTKAARRVFSEPWVEHALHGYGHPLKWKREILALSAEGRPFSVYDEFDRSIEVFSKIVMPNSNPKVFLWTGDCSPTEKQLLHATNLGLINMNGGDTMFDSKHNSHTSVAPLYRRVGKGLQVYASAANENIYTNEWAGPFYGFRNVIETFERTEKPRRLAPVNIYYHWYSGEYRASMQALEEVYAWAKKQDLVPIWGSRHIKNVKAYIECQYLKTNRGWIIQNHGLLKTIRFDKEKRTPLVSKATNVIGYKKQGQSIYIHLGQKESSEIIWEKQSSQQSMLSEANCVIEKLELTAQGIQMRIWGYNPARITFSNLKQPLAQHDQYKIESQKNKTIIYAKPQGTLDIDLKWTSTN